MAGFWQIYGNLICKSIMMVVEVLILYFVIYRLLYFLRRSRGVSVLVGLLGLLLLSVVFDKLGFKVITWLMSSLAPILGIALVIIFQPELRRAFAQLGSFSSSSSRRKQELVSEVVTAAERMSKCKCGALIVFERKIGLQALFDDALPVDMKLNSAVLESIFFPNSPMHDGAAIVRGDRIVATRTMLPLTKIANSRLGTRHRAAVGISEETDAVALIVSEESGSVSIACHGALYRDLSEETLRNYLESLLVFKNDLLSVEDELIAGMNEESSINGGR